MKLGLILLLCLTACNQETRDKMFPSPSQKAASMSYVKDERTQLCFVHNTVTNSNGFSDDIFTNVPCTPEVEKLTK